MTVTQADTALSTFVAKHDLRTRLSVQAELRLFEEACAMVWRTHQPNIAYREYERKRRELLAAQAALTDFRLLWDALSRALTGRDKIIIDAEKVPGRRHLLLFDPDQFRLPVPMIMAPERAPLSPRGPRGEDNEGP